MADTGYDAISNRITALQNHQGWLTPQAMSAYATSNLSDGDMMDQAERFRQTMVQSQRENGSPSAYQTFFSDPVLQKHPSVTLALRDFLTGAIGGDQVAGQSIRMQQNHLKALMPNETKDLQTSGVWDDGWQAAKVAYNQHVVNSQLQGNKPGSSTISHALDFLGAFNPVPAADALLGVVKGLPADFRKMTEDLGVGLGQIGYGVTHLANPVGEEATKAAAGEAVQIGNIGDQTPETGGQFYNELKNKSALGQVGEVAANGLTALALVDGLGAVSKAGKALGYGAEASTAAFAPTEAATVDEAAKGGGLVSRAVEGADTTAATYRGPGVIANKIGQPLMERLAVAADHVPILAHTGPTLDALADADGAYYKFRRLLALPYTYRPVQVAGEAASQLALKGAAVRGAAAAVPGTQFSKSVEGEHTFDVANEALKNVAKGTPLGSVLDLNNLAYVLHGPLGGAATSGAIGDKVRSVVKGVNFAADTPLKDIFGLTAITRGNSLPGWEGLFLQGLGMGRKAAVDAAGGEARFQTWMNDAINKHSMYSEAEHQVALQKLTDAGLPGIPVSEDPALITAAERDVAEKVLGQDLESMQAVNAKAKEIRDPEHPELMDAARTNLLSRRGGQEFVNRLQYDLSLQRQRDAMLGVPWEKGQAPNIGQYLDDSELLNHHVVPYLPPGGGLANQKAAELDAEAEYQAGVTGGVGAKTTTATDPRAAFWKRGPSRPQDLGIGNADLLTREEAARQGDKLRQQWEDNTHMQVVHDEKVVGGDPMMSPEEVDARFPEPDPNWQQDWNDELGDMLLRMGVDQRNMAEEGPELVDKAMQYAKALLPGEVAINDDAHVPGDLLDAMDTLKAHGKKLIVATDAGHMHIGESVLDDFGNTLTMRRRILNSAGLNPNITNDADVAARVRINLRNRISDMVAKGDVPNGMVLPAYTRPDTLIALLNEKGFLPDDLNWTGRIHQMFTQRAPRHVDLIKDPDVKAVAQKMWSENPEAKEKDIINNAMHLATQQATMHLQMRDLPYKDLRDSFGSPREFEERSKIAQARTVRDRNAQFEAGPPEPGTTPTPRASQLNTPMLDDRSVRNLQLALRKSYADLPASMVGWQKPENMFRASMGWAGNTGIKGRVLGGAVLGGAAGVTVDPSAVFQGDFSNVEKGAAAGALATGVFKKLGWAMANLPNDLIKFRNNFRFDLSPEFAARRWLKTSMKMQTEGVPPVGIESNILHSGPNHWLARHGVRDEARDILARTTPEYDTALQRMDRAGDEAQRYLASNDVFHLMNTRNMEAYAAYHWNQQGKSDDEIHDLIIKTFGYGAKDVNGVSQSGRSALEKSLNTVFFPFSFDKTLYRNMGGYLLDHAGQRLFLTQALAAYDQFNKQHPDMPGSAQWLDEHVPMLAEVNRLNAFSHGVGLGQFGGINAPMLQLFLPQQWSPSTQNQSLLEKYIPAVKDFKRIFTGASGQAGVFSQQADIIRSEITGKGQAETPWAQLQQAFDLRRKLDNQWGSVIAFNSGKKASDQVRFSIDPSYGVFAGQPITRSTIDRMVHHQYQPYDPTAGAASAIKNQGQWNEFLDQRVQGQSEYGAELADWGENVRSLGQRIQDARYVDPSSSRYWSPQQLEALSSSLRLAALHYAENDPQFADIYRKNFEHVLGPLEAVT